VGAICYEMMSRVDQPVLCRWLLFGLAAAMFRGNLQQTGVYDAAGLAKFNATKWKFQTSGRVIGSAVVNAVVMWAAGWEFYAIDAESREQRWKFTTKAWEDLVQSASGLRGIKDTDLFCRASSESQSKPS